MQSQTILCAVRNVLHSYAGTVTRMRSEYVMYIIWMRELDLDAELLLSGATLVKLLTLDIGIGHSVPTKQEEESIDDGECLLAENARMHDDAHPLDNWWQHIQEDFAINF